MSSFRVVVHHDGADRSGMHSYTAELELPKRVEFVDLLDALDELRTVLGRHRPMMVLASPTVIESRQYTIVVSTQGLCPHGPCYHLADSDQRADTLSTEPCKLCGRYYVDD